MQMSRGVTKSRVMSIMKGYSSLPIVVSGASMVNSSLDGSSNRVSGGATCTFIKSQTKGRTYQLRSVVTNGKCKICYLYELPKIEDFRYMALSFGVVTTNPLPVAYEFNVGLINQLLGDLETIVTEPIPEFSLKDMYGEDCAELISYNNISNPIGFDTHLYNRHICDMAAAGANDDIDYYLYFESIVNDYSGVQKTLDLCIYDAFMMV